MDIVTVLRTLLSEFLDGPAPEAAWMLNPKDPGLLASLDKLSAKEASTIQPDGSASVAAHVDHLRYGLGLMNRWAQGEKDPFSGANWGSSWERSTVSDEQWTALREEFRKTAYAWREAMKKVHDLNDFELTGMVASVAHLGYHMGAMRQIHRSLRGPSAQQP